MNSKKAITLLVLATMILSLVPVVPVQAIGDADCYTIDAKNTATTTFDQTDVKGATRAVVGDGVTAGKTIELYWDSVEDWDGEVGLLNTTKAKASGSFEVWFDVPESTGGNHYLWVRDTFTGDTQQVDVTGASVYNFIVVVKSKLSSSSGLAGYKPTLTLNGLGDEEEVALLLTTAAYGGTGVVGEDLGDTAIGTQTYTGTAVNTPIVPGTFTATDTVEAWTDTADGLLDGAGVGTGTIDYLTGEWEFTYAVASAGVNQITGAYSYYLDVTDACYTFDADAEASALGTISKALTIPSEGTMDKGAYKVAFLRSNGVTELTYTIGAVITVDVDEGPSGTIVEITGKGFDGETIVSPGKDTITAADVYISDGTLDEVCTLFDAAYPVTVDADGEFKIEVVIPVPQAGDWEDYNTIIVKPTQDAGGASDNNNVEISTDFDVVGVSEISVTPGYGIQGESIVVEGWNFTASSDETIEIELYTVGDDPLVDASLQWIVDAETDSNGHFSETIQIPAISSGEYEVGAHADTYTLSAVDDLRIGMMIVIMSPTNGPSGTKVTLSGTGYTLGETWNATFNGDELFGTQNVDGSGNIKVGAAVPTFYVPTMDPGTYTIEVLDIDADIAVEVEFTVTEKTMIEVDPMVAPQDYNVSISGKYFATKAANALDFVLYNSTEDWDMLVYQQKEATKIAAVGNADGNFSAWWNFNNENLNLDIGEYMINVTDGEDLFAQVAFSVVSKTVDIEPRKATFSIGETVGFDVESSFSSDNSYIQIWEPSGDLY